MFTRSTLRRLAALALLSWVFATASGLAHACGWLGEPLTGASAAVVADAAAMATMPGHDHAAMGHGDDSGVTDDDGVPPASQPLCAKFCDSDKASSPEVRLSLDPTLQAQLWITVWPALALTDPGQAAAVARPDARLAQARSPDDIPIAFLRLTL